VRVVIDARLATAPDKTGIGYYTWHMIDLLPRVDPRTTYVAWYPNPRSALRPRMRRRFRDQFGSPNLKDSVAPIPSWVFERPSWRLGVPRIEWTARFDVLLAPNFIPPPTRTRRLVLTVHDLAFRLFPETAPQNTREWLAPLGRWLKQASRVIVVSEQTRRDLLDTYAVAPDVVTVVPLGVDADVFRPASPESIDRVRRRYGIEGPYLVSLAGIEPRKNLPALVRAYASLEDDVRPALVLTGPVTPVNPEGWALLRPVLDGLPTRVRERIVLTGYVPERDKVALLSGAEALVCPSLYEGFGLPVVEAMACGTPVLTSTVSALPETAGGAALLIDPRDQEAIAGGMERLLADPPLRERLRVAGLARSKEFSWKRTAVRTAEVLHQAGE
jgi:glycosyltransferase involved in cell wall biosynthesis